MSVSDLANSAYENITEYGNGTMFKLLRSNRTYNKATMDYDGSETEIQLYAYSTGISLSRNGDTTIKSESAKILARIDNNFDGSVFAGDRIKIGDNKFSCDSVAHYVGSNIAYVEFMNFG